MHETLDLVELLMGFLIAFLSRNRSFSVSQRGNKKQLDTRTAHAETATVAPAIGVQTFLTRSGWPVSYTHLRAHET